MADDDTAKRRWLESLEEGDELDVFDEHPDVQEWLIGQISRIHSKRMKSQMRLRIHFVGWPEKWDKWIPATALAMFAPLNTHTPSFKIYKYHADQIKGFLASHPSGKHIYYASPTPSRNVVQYDVAANRFSTLTQTAFIEHSTNTAFTVAGNELFYAHCDGSNIIHIKSLNLTSFDERSAISLSCNSKQAAMYKSDYNLNNICKVQLLCMADKLCVFQNYETNTVFRRKYLVISVIEMAQLNGTAKFLRPVWSGVMDGIGMECVHALDERRVIITGNKSNDYILSINCFNLKNAMMVSGDEKNECVPTPIPLPDDDKRLSGKGRSVVMYGHILVSIVISGVLAYDMQTERWYKYAKMLPGGGVVMLDLKDNYITFISGQEMANQYTVKFHAYDILPVQLFNDYKNEQGDDHKIVHGYLMQQIADLQLDNRYSSDLTDIVLSYYPTFLYF